MINLCNFSSIFLWTWNSKKNKILVKKQSKMFVCIQVGITRRCSRGKNHESWNKWSWILPTWTNSYNLTDLPFCALLYLPVMQNHPVHSADLLSIVGHDKTSWRLVSPKKKYKLWVLNIFFQSKFSIPITEFIEVKYI